MVLWVGVFTLLCVGLVVAALVASRSGVYRAAAQPLFLLSSISGCLAVLVGTVW